MDPSIVLSRGGLRELLPFAKKVIRVDPVAGRIDFPRGPMELKDLRHLEVERGYLNLGTERDWETIDLEGWRDGSGPLLAGGALSPGGVRLIEALKEAIARNRETAQGAPGDPGPAGTPSWTGAREIVQRFDFRYLVRIDRLGVILTVASVLLFLLDLYLTTHDWDQVISGRGVRWFLLFLLLATAALFWKRAASRLRFDGRGITSKGIFGSRSYPWGSVREFRRQHGELEFTGDGLRLNVSLEILASGGTPLILRRGRVAMMTLPGRLFLSWLRTRIEEKAEPPIEFAPGERRRARWWIGGIAAVNTMVFLAERPFSGSEKSFLARLIEMGARTEAWTNEPWRLITSLFLHGSTFHLVMNMFALAILGPWIAWIYGWPRTLALYLSSGILGNVIGQVIAGKDSPPAVGASTAILGLLGALLGVTYRRPERVPLAARARLRWAIPLLLLLTLGMGLAIPVLDNGAHIGGFIAGLALVWLLPPRKIS